MLKLRESLRIRLPRRVGFLRVCRFSEKQNLEFLVLVTLEILRACVRSFRGFEGTAFLTT